MVKKENGVSNNVLLIGVVVLFLVIVIGLYVVYTAITAPVESEVIGSQGTGTVSLNIVEPPAEPSSDTGQGEVTLTIVDPAEGSS